MWLGKKVIIMKNTLTLIAILLSFTSHAVAEVRVTDLEKAIAEGLIRTEAVTGNGSSSGASLRGYLINETASEINVDTTFSNPIFFKNGGSGQNMVALQVYGDDGRYRKSGRRSFITLPPRAKSTVRFVAYCADFEKDNPSENEQFSAGTLPARLRKVAANINKYAQKYPQRNITVAAQVAIWMAQDIHPAKIQEKIPFQQSDEELARSFLR